MKYQCCFCGNEIVPKAPDPVQIVVKSADPLEEQDLYCHQRCLQRALYPNVPLLVGEDE